MPGGRHTFYFEGKEPLVLWVVALLLFGNTLLMFLLEFGRRHIDDSHLPVIVTKYSDHVISVQFVLLAMLMAILVVFRKRVYYVRRK